MKDFRRNYIIKKAKPPKKMVVLLSDTIVARISGIITSKNIANIIKTVKAKATASGLAEPLRE